MDNRYMKILGIVLTILFSTVASVHASISMTLDRDLVDFRTMESGQTQTVADQGVYHNELTCSSTNNRTWYIKANMIRPLTSGANTIASENLKWMVVDVINGKGIVFNNRNIANPFSFAKGLVYTSDPADNTGTQVKLRFRYILAIPKNQTAGNYYGSVRWTMTEVL